MFTHKVLIYGPYTFLLISKTWEKLYPTKDFLAPDWIRHDPIRLRIKPSWLTLLLMPRLRLLRELLMRRRLRRRM